MDTSFLDAPMPRWVRPKGVLNIYELLGLSSLELTADRTLAYFLDPTERHGLATRFVDALLTTLDNATLVNERGLRPTSLPTADLLGSLQWRVDRQVAVEEAGEALSELSWKGYIDLYLTNDELDIAIIIENKVMAALHNPLESYIQHAVDEGYGSVLLVVLAPYSPALDGAVGQWISRAIRYADLFEALGEINVKSADENGKRSLALLTQFKEIRQGSEPVTDYVADAKYVNEFRDVVDGRSAAIEAFFEAQDRVNKLFRRRSEALGPLVTESLHAAGLVTGWEAHGYKAGRWTYAWNAYHPTESDNSVELILTPNPAMSAAITIKAYPGRKYKYFPDMDHVSIGVSWRDSDETIADAFVKFAAGVALAHPGGA